MEDRRLGSCQAPVTESVALPLVQQEESAVKSEPMTDRTSVFESRLTPWVLVTLMLLSGLGGAWLLLP